MSVGARRAIASVFLLSWTTIALQLSLIRILSVTRWHHFTFFVISTALLGYGVSGIALLLAGDRWKGRADALLLGSGLATVTLGLAAVQVALLLPIDSQYLFQSPDQILLFALYNVLGVVPFLLAAAGIGIPLMRYPEESSTIYAASLLGTGLGGTLAVGTMFFLREEQLLGVSMLPALAAGLLWIGRPTLLRGLAAAAAAGYLALSIARPPGFFLEGHKSLAQMRRLEEQGDAKRLLTRHSPRGRIDVYESPLLHFTLFAGVNATAPPPTQLAILRDGFSGATVFRISSPDEAPILDQVPASLAYRLRPRARALLLGEGGGTNVWLARRFGASEVTVVQPDPEIVAVMTGPLAEASGGVFSERNARVVREEPRLFVEGTSGAYDVIQMVSAEEMAAETRGAAGLQEDYLLTVEGMRAAFRRLAPGGLVTLSRGIQVPARDSLKLAATMREALAREGAADPGAHLVLLQNYLSDTLLLFREPPGPEDRARLLAAAKELALEVRWPPPIAAPAAPRKGPLPSVGEALGALLGPGASRFANEWVYDIRPPRDDRPYFRDFFRFRALPWLREVYGEDWYLRLELGFVILLASAAEILVLSCLILLVPVVVHTRRERRRAGETGGASRLGAAFVYFYGIGVGFMGFEIVAISRMTLFLGDPLYAATVAITCLLLGAGAGSAVAGRNLYRVDAMVRWAVGGILVWGALLLALLGPAGSLSSLSLPLRVAVACAGLAPLSFLLGFLFPSGLHLARRSSGTLVAWGWGVNGFASVAAPPLITMLAMSAGQRLVLVLSLGCYGLAALAAARMRAPRPEFES